MPRAGGELTNPSSDYNSEKSSKLNQKTLGLTNRIWLILVLFIFIIILTRSVLPSDPSLPRHGVTDTRHLTPKNYMNLTETHPNPFEFCPLFGPGDEIGAKHGIHALTKSRLHLGSSTRVQRVIHKALSGLPVTISILGGSGTLLFLFPYVSHISNVLQCPLATVLGMTPFRRNVIHHASSNGGIVFSRIPLLS